MNFVRGSLDLVVMRSSFVFCVWVVAQVLLFSSVSVAQPSFDCTEAEIWSEIQVCNDQALSALDQEVVTLFGDAKARLIGQAQQQLIAEQRMWLRERESCEQQLDPAACLLGVYNRRILQLSAPRDTRLPTASVQLYAAGSSVAGSAESKSTPAFPDFLTFLKNINLFALFIVCYVLFIVARTGPYRLGGGHYRVLQVCALLASVAGIVCHLVRGDNLLTLLPYPLVPSLFAWMAYNSKYKNREYVLNVAAYAAIAVVLWQFNAFLSETARAWGVGLGDLFAGLSYGWPDAYYFFTRALVWITVIICLMRILDSKFIEALSLYVLLLLFGILLGI